MIVRLATDQVKYESFLCRKYRCGPVERPEDFVTTPVRFKLDRLLQSAQQLVDEGRDVDESQGRFVACSEVAVPPHVMELQLGAHDERVFKVGHKSRRQRRGSP